MIKTPLSTVIGGAFWTPGATVIGGNTPTLDQQIQKLFANGEQGFYYDPNDLSTMYQDAAGTVPVTSVGQPVGLILDKSKGLTLKPTAVPNSGFDLDISDWVAGPTLTATWSNGQARIVGSGGIITIGNTLRSNTVGGPNKLFKISFDATWVSGGYLQAGAPYREGLRVLPTENAGIKKRYTYQLALHPVSPYNISCFAAESGAVWLIDNVSVEEITGNHAYQTVSASRPILRQNSVTGANYLEFDGSDDGLQTNNIDFTATDKMSLFAGVRKLSDVQAALCIELGDGSSATLRAFALFAPAGSGIKYDLRNVVTAAGAGTTDIEFSSPNSAVLSGVVTPNNTDTVLLRVNSRLVATTQSGRAGNFIAAPLYIGRRAGTTLPFNGHIYSLIGVSKLTSDKETAVIEKEIAKRLGVTLNV